MLKCRQAQTCTISTELQSYCPCEVHVHAIHGMFKNSTQMCWFSVHEIHGVFTLITYFFTAFSRFFTVAAFTARCSCNDLHGSNVKSHTLPLISSKFSSEPFKGLSGYASSRVSQKFRPELPGKWATITQWTTWYLFTTLKELYRSLTHRPRGWKCRHPARYRRANGSFASCEGRQIDGS